MSRRRTHDKRQMRSTLLMLFAFLSLVLSGCGDKAPDPLDTYREKMDAFYTSVARIDRAIDALDVNADDAPQALLSELDHLNALFADMAEIEIPEEFAGMGDLPAEAADYMNKAVNAYHDAYDGEFDEDAEALAGQYYERANLRIRYMLAILRGDEETIQEVTGENTG